MVEIFGKNYYIDIENIVNKCTTYIPVKIDEDDEDDDKQNAESTTTIEVNIFKYEIIKMCLDRILNDIQDVDEEMGIFAHSEDDE